jgi:hypothetical protein
LRNLAPRRHHWSISRVKMSNASSTGTFTRTLTRAWSPPAIAPPRHGPLGVCLERAELVAPDASTCAIQSRMGANAAGWTW